MSQVAQLTSAFQAVAADVKALQARPGAAVRMPFYDAAGLDNGILLTSGELPFFDAAGAQHNILLVTYG